MVMEQQRATTFDEVSMERSKNFVFALQELKNLRPQLYSAAEYCEKSYLNSDHKQMVLDNLKDYAVRALVNAVDHLGTVAYKLTDLLDQQTLDVSTMDLKISTLNQRLLTCKIYTDKEGLRQQQLLAFIPRHHKHYILPNHVNRKVHFSPRNKMDARQNQIQTRNRLQSSGTPVAKTLSWHLASETKSTLKKRTSHASAKTKDPNFSAKTSGVFHLLGILRSSEYCIDRLIRVSDFFFSCPVEIIAPYDSELHVDNEESTRMKPAAQTQLPNGIPNYTTAIQTTGVMGRDAFEGSKPTTGFRSFDIRNQPETLQVPNRSKSVLSAFFVKQKMPKLKTGSIS
ncbi:hypothetical protein Ahy_B06g081380 isoform B [Arachis hypogaea]|uniref:Protein ABIL1 n=1 Tax=Arachis hypogaea TaxID=3818 RepID=A0A444YKU3_ARAHY|nr:hypothetical protein Ahy_B06g081380 isoform B [Arachis hypogaea]